MDHRAIFLDRDGTLVHPRHYPARPEELVLYDGIGPALYALQQRGFKLIVVTNQAGIARGYFTDADLRAMHDHLRRELARDDVYLDAIYHCPHHRDGVIPEFAIACACRKPGTGMLERAALEFDLDLSRCWLIGDILDDIEAGNRVGCRTILVDLGTEMLPGKGLRCPCLVAGDTVAALGMIGALEETGAQGRVAVHA